MRFFWFIFLLLVLVLGPFLIWGEFFETFFSVEKGKAWLDDLGPWAALAGIGLLMADLVLPLPGTTIIFLLGMKYGFVVGGLAGAIGSILSGILAYGVCRTWGRRPARWIVGEADLEKGERVFRRSGGWIVALSRWLPMAPEIIACSAGVARMPFRPFLLALICGGVPLGFSYAALGAFGKDQPLIAGALSLLIPPILWAIIHPLVRSRMKDEDAKLRR
ncbi:MAG: putative membrane protein YdjX (TVP38/TMEM64 family) [Verrucomicrobiales bacterium]